MSHSTPFDVIAFVKEHFTSAGIPNASVEVRDFPEESIVVVSVESDRLNDAIELANALDRDLESRGFDGFVTVRKSTASAADSDQVGPVKTLADQRALSLVNLLTARSRTSEIQPSLSYIADVENNIAIVTGARHHLIFGRRGAGKTALMAEAKRLVEADGHVTVWCNIQTYRHESSSRMLLQIALRLCEMVQLHFRQSQKLPKVALAANALHDRIQALLRAKVADSTRVQRLLPDLQSMMRQFLQLLGLRAYIFLDDFHYFQRVEQPLVLDMLHACVRDCNAWIKVATIEHLSLCYDPARQMGLESGHDAAQVNLDVTLQDPRRAKSFLERMLLSYAQHCGIHVLSNVYSRDSLDRLVLASGGVPRDYLLLCARSVQQAQQRENARQVGVQDVNRAAGDAKQAKIAELEDDAAAAQGEGAQLLKALHIVRTFCTEEKNWTAFRIEFSEKEGNPRAYGVLMGMMDLRLIHLVDPSLSDEHHAGRRSEVFLLDLSQYAGQRLRKHLRVIDFSNGYLVLKETGTPQPDRVGNTSNKRLSLLRRTPLLPLSALQPCLEVK